MKRIFLISALSLIAASLPTLAQSVNAMPAPKKSAPVLTNQEMKRHGVKKAHADKTTGADMPKKVQHMSSGTAGSSHAKGTMTAASPKP